MLTSKYKRMLTAMAFAVLGLLQAGMAQALGVGDKAPAFSVPSTSGKEIALADYAGKKAVVLFFYIGAFTNA